MVTLWLIWRRNLLGCDLFVVLGARSWNYISHGTLLSRVRDSCRIRICTGRVLPYPHLHPLLPSLGSLLLRHGHLRPCLVATRCELQDQALFEIQRVTFIIVCTLGCSTSFLPFVSDESNVRAGQNLTIGVSEVVEGAVITGSARIVEALVTSLQLGFGLMIGEKLVWWLPKLDPKTCADPNISPWFIIIW